jgi:septal ring factor EnvC (AmiA/AmiB activator)
MAPKKKASAIELIEKNENQAAAEPTKAKRNFRSAEERIAEIDKKIAFHTKSIEQLEARKGKIGTGRRARKLSYAKVFAELKSSGKTPEEIKAFLNT